MWQNYCSRNSKEVESVATDEIFLETSIKITLKSEQPACDISQLVQEGKQDINVHHNQNHRLHVPKRRRSHRDETVTLSPRLCAAGGLFLWSHLLFLKERGGGGGT